MDYSVLAGNAKKSGSHCSANKPATSKKKMKEKSGSVNSEESKKDPLDDTYNLCLASQVSKMLAKKSIGRGKTSVDKQLATLQKRFNDDLEMLEEARTSIAVVSELTQQTDLISFHTNFLKSVGDEPAFGKGKSLTELMNETETLKNQLPCKGLVVPKSRPDIASLQNAASQLVMSLDRMSTADVHDEEYTTRSLEKLQNITQDHDGLQTMKHNIAVDEPKVSACVVDEAASKSMRRK